MKIPDAPKVGLVDVLKAFWQGVRPWQWAFWFSLFAFFASSALQLVTPLYYKSFFDILTKAGDRTLLVPSLVHLLVLILAVNALSWFFSRSGFFVLNYFESRVMARLRQIAFGYLIRHSYSFFANTFAGALTQRVNRFARSFEQLFDTFVFNFVPLLVNIIGAIIVVWFQEKILAFIIMGWVLVTIAFNYTFSRWKLKYDLKKSAADTATSAALSDSITNQNSVSSFAGAEFEAESFRKVSNDQGRAEQTTWNLGSSVDAVQAGLITLIEFLIFYYALQFWREGTMTVGTFVLVQVYILGLAGRLWSFSQIVRNFYQGFADSKEMVEILNLPHEVEDIPHAKRLNVAEGAIELKDLSFAFKDNATRLVLEHVNTKITGGEKVALIGPSGAGKSTIVKLLLRMYNLDIGQILIDDQDIQKVTQESLRSNISLVPQDPVLFHRTLMENIRYGRRDATDEEVITAARLAHCDEFIEHLPLKYETFVGERGIKLSGGERQRVAIARAILKNAPILILDEATSSLDSHSEALIQDALDKLMKGKTTIVIAHRLSTIRKMDRILVIDGGKIVEEGRHDDLVGRDESLYKRLWNLQAGGFIAE